MAIANTKKEKDKQAAEDLAKKILIETNLGLNLRRLFREIGYDAASEYGTNGSILSLHKYEKDLTGILRDSYRNSVNKFSSNIRNDVDKKISLELEHKIDKKLSDFFHQHSEVQSAFIIGTTDFYLKRIIKDIIEESKEEQITRAEIADKSRKRFNEIAISHTNTIAITETNAAAEKSKSIEAEELTAAGLTIGGLTLANVLMKEWHSILDEVTRTPPKSKFDHVSADGQQVPITEPFIVSGERLMVPGDTSLGASLGNVIGCRCSCIYTTKSIDE